MKGVKIDVEIYETIRKLYTHEGLSQRAIARKLGISRNTVAKYVSGSNVPWERKTYSLKDNKVITEEVLAFIQSCFAEDASHKHLKQNHTAKRIFDRLQLEKGFTGSYTSVRRAVNKLKDKSAEPFIPLAFDPGESAQVDFGSAYVIIDGVEQKIKYFCMRLCYSAHIFVKAYFVEKEECFLDGLSSAFEFFGGVPKNIIFDNAKVAVKDGYGAYVTKLTDGYRAFKSHYAFNALFCNPSSGNEKGLVENLVGYIRRNTMVPIPRIASIEELNVILANRCRAYTAHKIKGHACSVGENYVIEKAALTPLPTYHYEIAKSIYTTVNGFSTVTYETNKYSVPTGYIGREVLLKAFHSKIKITYKNEVIAIHCRSFQKNKRIYDIKHYMDALERKPRAIFNAEPVRAFVPKEILDNYSKIPGGNQQVLSYIKKQINLDNEENMITVTPTNLSSYDCLIKKVQS